MYPLIREVDKDFELLKLTECPKYSPHIHEETNVKSAQNGVRNKHAKSKKTFVLVKAMSSFSEVGECVLILLLGSAS